MCRVCVAPREIQDRVGELAAFFLIKIAHAQENLRDDVLIESRVSRRWDGRKLPGHPTGRIGHAAIFFRKSSAGQAIHSRVDCFLFFEAYSGGSPEFAGLILIDLADNQPVGLL